MPFTSENARALGAKGGASKASRKLTLSRVAAELGPLKTVQDAMRRLERLNIWISAGLLTGSQGGAAVRSIEVWLKGHESRLGRRGKPVRKTNGSHPIRGGMRTHN